MKFTDVVLNRFTMYRIVLYLLLILFGIALTFSFFGILPYDPVILATNSAIIFTSCFILNLIFSKIFKAVTSFESVFITALILILITPVQFSLPFWVFILMPFFAMGGKYIFTLRKRHIFNPAALGVFLVGFVFPDAAATWWVGDKLLFIPVLFVSFFVIKKTRRLTLIFTFLGTYMLLTSFIYLSESSNILNLLNSLWTSMTASALIFFACIMLTEPLTSASKRKHQIYYAMLVAALFASSRLQLPTIVMTAEAALLFGNIFSFIVNPKYRFSLPLIEMKKLSPTIYSFSFPKDKSFHFEPGQYMEWTLPHKNMDSRGNRRFISLASSPTEDIILVVIRYYKPPSSYKKGMIELSAGDKIIATNLSGDFVLPKNVLDPLVFVAGGVGITPFRSMLKYIIDKKLSVNIVLLFINKTENEIVFKDIFQEAERYGVKTINVITNSTEVHSGEEKGHVTEEMITRMIPDFKNRTFYISGSQLMVQNLHDMFKKMGIKKIKTDFFPGYTEK